MLTQTVTQKNFTGEVTASSCGEVLYSPRLSSVPSDECWESYYFWTEEV
jgi:hypothetical protein